MQNIPQPLVSIGVITYNSSKTVLETLDSIADQTYQNLELIVSDDCSTDNTVGLCRDWIESHKERFVRTEILTVKKNTGISANGNRAEVACLGMWIKLIAGDDRLLPNCIDDCISYVKQNPDTIYLFGKVKVLGSDSNNRIYYEKLFNGDFFKLTQDQQLHELIFNNNMIPAATCFYNRAQAAAISIKNDERIPMLEDWPKWINLLKAGVKFHFIDSYLVEYRIDGGVSTSQTMQSPAVHRSFRLFYYLYLFPYRYKEKQEDTIIEIINEECGVYDAYYRLNYYLNNSLSYKLFKTIIKPLSWVKKCFRS